METKNPTHFQLYMYIQITHYADIVRYCTGSVINCTKSHLTGSVIALLVTCYRVTGKRFSLASFVAFVNGENCTNEMY